jgi:general secretion pathway protein B
VKTPTGTGTAPAPGVTPSPPVQHLATERRAAAQPVSEPAAIAPIDALPSATRSQLPKLSLGGSIYSDDPAARFLIINGSTFHQGDPVAPDLVLEQIGPHDAVLNFKGQHFRLAF